MPHGCLIYIVLPLLTAPTLHRLAVSGFFCHATAVAQASANLLAAQIRLVLMKPPTCLSCRYDKSAFAGRGDRADPSTWPVVSGPVELVFFEGWMLGFKPVGAEAAGGVESSLMEVNKQLGAYQEAWDSLVDSWLVIRIADPQVCL